MKKLVLLGGLGAVILVVIISNLLFKNDANQEEVLVESPTLTSSTVLLQPLAAAVSVFDDGLSNWSEVTSETPLLDGTRIKTSATGRALITRDTAIMTSVDSNTEMTLVLSEDQKTNILKLVAGQTWTKITRALEQDEVYEVHTPTMVAAVRGTSFGVATEPASQITVTDGIVWASLIDPETGEIDESTTVVVPAGKIVIYLDGKLEVRDIEDKDKGDWYYEHNPEEKREDTPAEAETKDDEETVNDTDPVVDEGDENEVVPPVVSKKVTVTSVSPKVIDQKVAGGRLTLRGEFLGEVDKVVVEGRGVEFLLTSAQVIVIEAAELPDKEGAYDLILYYDDQELFLRDAFSIVNSEVVLKIDSAGAGQTESPEDFIELKGTGFSKVTTVLVNGQSNEFVSINDQLMHIFDYSFSRAKTIKLISPDSEVTYTAL